MADIQGDNSADDIFNIFQLDSSDLSKEAAIPAFNAQEVPSAAPAAGTDQGPDGNAPQPAPAPSAEPSSQTPPAAPAAPGATPPADGTPAPTPAPSPAPVDETALRLRSMEAQLEALRLENEALKKPATQTPGATPPAGADAGSGQQEAETPQYALQIPNDVAAAIFGEDAGQAHAGLNALVSSLATAIHRNVTLQYRNEMKVMREQLEAASTSQAEEVSAKTAQEQYYEQFPGHNKPLIAPIIADVNRRMAAEMPNHPWNKDWIAALGARVNAAIAELTGGTPEPTPTPTPAPAPAPAAKPAGFVPSAPRSAIPAFEQETPDQVLDVFSAS